MNLAGKTPNSLFLTLILVILIPLQVTGQSDTTDSEVKKGWTFGVLPAISYDTDRGFKYGGLINFFNYGDGSTYPDYLKSIYLEWSRTTKGSGINMLRFDSKKLSADMPVRMTINLSYLTERSMDFYGFNGYESLYRPKFEDKSSEDYISRMFYRYERNLFYFSAIFQNKLFNSDFKWLGGVEHFTHKLDNFDFERYNEGEDNNKLKDTLTLFEYYKRWGLISKEEAEGGTVNYLKAGLIYDTRDQEANPMKGIWSEIMLSAAPGFLWNKENQYIKLSCIHRQYFTLIPKDLNLALRVGYQGTIMGEAPFYMQSYLIKSFKSANVEGLGGKKSLRGIRRNRILGDDIAYSNLELRWKFWRMKLLRQNLYIALSGFWDSGIIVDPIAMNTNKIPPTVDEERFFGQPQDNSIHSSIGAGLHFALNKNFIVSVDYGKALDTRDGDGGLYIGMDFLY